jgi:STE24 endopeptidase
MKKLPFIGLSLLAFLVVSTLVPPTSDVVEEAKRYFTDEEISQGQEFSLQRRWIFWANALVQLCLLVYLVFTPLGKRIYLATGAVVQSHWFAHIVLLGVVYFIASAALSFPFELWRYNLNQRWGMSTQDLQSWLGDYVTALVVTAILEGITLFGFYAIVRNFPRVWWLISGAAAIVVGFIVAMIIPNVIAPLFNTLTPINQTEWKNFDPRIRGLGVDDGITAASVYVVDASRQGVHGNAYYSGFGGTQRIVLYDNLLKTHTPDEVDVVIAHEMGHWRNQDILQGILLGGLAITAGLYLLYRYMNTLIDDGALRSASDPAGVFRVILLAQVALALSLPFQNYVSRIMERNADEVALVLSQSPRAFISAEKRLAVLNKSNVAPSRWNVILFASHPPVVERIQMAEQWEKDQTAKK